MEIIVKKTSRRIIGIAILMVILFIFIFIYFIYWKQDYIKLIFKEGNQSIVNSNRGFYAQIDSKDYPLVEGYYNGDEKFRIVLMGINLIKDINHDKISEEKMIEIRKALDECRRVGMAVVVRAAYHFWGDDYNQPDNFETILSHVGQLADVINPYKDIVLGIQAGFIGPYGEWHNSPYMEEDEESVPFRIKLLQELFLKFDEEIVINVRRPMFIREALEYGLAIERFGIHNDALLSTDNDMGTYVEEGYDRKTELAWMEENILTQINGGEMTNISEYTKIENAVLEFHKMNLTYLNRYYNTEVLEDFKKQSYGGKDGYTYIKEHLGYRLSLSTVILPDTMVPGQRINMEIEIRNTGFAKPSKNYTPFLAVKLKDQIKYYPLEGDFVTKEAFRLVGEINPYSLFSNELSEYIELCIRLGEDQYIELANEHMTQEEGIYWFTSYRYINKEKRYRIVEESK